MSVTWWRSLHQAPTVLRPGAPTIAGSMLAALLVGVVAFTILYVYLIALRLRVGRLEDRAASEALSARISEQPLRGAREPARPAQALDGQVAQVGAHGRSGPNA
jgi:heme exporter protein C